MNQQTLKGTYSFEGRGLHTGRPVHVRLCPAPADTGIVFERTDLGGARVEALASNVCSTRRSTMLGRGKAKVGTVEHVLSALLGLGIDNALIEIDSAEMPILDGSARPYAEAIDRDGVLDQGVPRKWVKLKREIIVRNDRSGAWIKLTPAAEPSVEVTVDYNSKVLGTQTVTYSADDDYVKSIAPCRTFCFLHEIVPQLLFGLIKGGDLDNALVVVEKPAPRWVMRRIARLKGRKDVPEAGKPGYLAEGGLRFPDECGRHKLLDLLGDLRLCGGLPCFRVEAFKPGHALNTAAAREVLKSL